LKCLFLGGPNEDHDSNGCFMTLEGALLFLLYLIVEMRVFR
jgi:hypothetical protein